MNGEWISVTERLPEDGEWVWCYGPNRGCEAACISKYWDGWVGTDRKNLVAGAYTHWMPLPEPPEVKAFSPAEIKQAIASLNLGFENERLKQRIAYLTSVKDASRLHRMRLAEENLWLRELAGIAPDAEVPRPLKQWTPDAE
jgi:hypothetical protein